MPSSRLSTIFTSYRSKRKESAEEERKRRTGGARRPEIIDPSFELFGYQTPPSEPALNHYHVKSATSTTAQPAEDWVYQNRRASTTPASYQHDHYCQVTPQSSISSTSSGAANKAADQGIDMGWGTSNPRPSSYLPQMPRQASESMFDLHSPNVYANRRVSVHIADMRRHADTQSPFKKPTPSSNFGATLNRPFSLTEPFESLNEDTCDITKRSSPT